MATLLFLILSLTLLLSCSASFDLPLCLSTGISNHDCNALAKADLQGTLSFIGNQIDQVSTDFGGIIHQKPKLLFTPKSTKDVCTMILEVGSSHNLTLAPRGNGHSTGGQAQALNGVVMNMSNLKGFTIGAEESYVDAGAGELWVDLLRFTLNHELAPSSWTDYLDLTIGGTLSNAGISGQTFRFGPQIKNVLELEVVTGLGERLICNQEMNRDLFNGVLGGLGQFGVITKARILLQRAPHRVRYIRVVYAKVEDFVRDQVRLVSLPKGHTFDYIEGFILANENTIDGWKSVPFSSNQTFNSTLIPQESGPILYCLELGFNYFNYTSNPTLEQSIEELMRGLGYIRGLEFVIDLSYFDFLYRVHAAEVAQRSSGSWLRPHAWLNLFLPQKSIMQFDTHVFRTMLNNGVGGPVLVYPVNSTMWDPEMSAVFPEEEEIFYAISVLRSLDADQPITVLESQMKENSEIINICRRLDLKCKKYLGRFESTEEWKEHFGSNKWELFTKRKSVYDPKHILTPGQSIFMRN
ncbi:cytokinin dehydrogenase 7 [Amborella trichopoda]|nr:cytokinin dehydrogenase 7 [Amborella trichopoda]|eukprot:XP_006849989.2 cytokinin dehydrogenase 7 [Amborella trichopoda]